MRVSPTALAVTGVKGLRRGSSCFGVLALHLWSMFLKSSSDLKHALRSPGFFAVENLQDSLRFTPRKHARNAGGEYRGLRSLSDRGQENYKYHFEVYLRYIVLQLH